MKFFIISILSLLLAISNLGAQEYFFQISGDQTLTVRAIPVDGYKFIGWYDTEIDGFLSFSNPYKIENIHSDIRIEAIFELKDVFSIYPNPASEILTVETFRRSTITIYNLQGGIVEQRNERAYMHTINVGWMSSGSYIIKMQMDQKAYFSKFIIINR